MKIQRISRFAVVLGCALMISTNVQAHAAAGYAVRVSPSLGDFTFIQPVGNMEAKVFYSCEGTLRVNIGVEAETVQNGNATGSSTSFDQPCPASDRPLTLLFYTNDQPFRPDSTIRFTSSLYQHTSPSPADPAVKKAENKQEICPNANLGNCPA